VPAAPGQCGDGQSGENRAAGQPEEAVEAKDTGRGSPAKAPLGIAWAGKAAPRMTTKNPTAPAMTATIVPTAQAFSMKLSNIGQWVLRSPGVRVQ
jgi:hypothetical protein